MPEKVLQAVRGMPDVVPAQVGPWQWFERLVRDTIQGYGYQEIRLSSPPNYLLDRLAKSQISSRRRCTPSSIATKIL